MIAFNVTDYGAVGDGRTLNTPAIQRTVDACAAAGGGRVHVPAGVFLSGPVFLRSHVEFHLAAGATLRGVRDMSGYPPLDVRGHGYHIDKWWHASLLTGCNLQNVSITGRGILDGQGQDWWKAKEAGGDLWENRDPPGQLTSIRPVLIFLFGCERVLIDGVQLVDSPMWNLVPIFCRNVTICDVSIQNPWKPYHNCDGIDLVSCRNVRVTGCHVDTGDDGICLKTVPDFGLVSGCREDGRWGPDYTKPHIPCENVIIENCIVEHAHSGVGIWAEVIGGMRNIVVSNCVFDGTRSGIRIARWPWPGGYVRDVRVDNIVMRRVEWVVDLSSYLDPAHVEDAPGADDTPVFQNIHFSNITATQARAACESRGLPKAPIRDISFSHIRIEADKGLCFRDAEDVFLDDVTVSCPGPALTAVDVCRLEVRRLTAARPQADLPAIQLSGCPDARLHDGPVLPGAAALPDQTPRESCPVWSMSSYAYSGSGMWRTSGQTNPFLPVPAAVETTIRGRWDQDHVDHINGIHRLESGARSDVVLPPGDRRRIYIVMAWGSPEVLIVCEDGELLKEASGFDYKDTL